MNPLDFNYFISTYRFLKLDIKQCRHRKHCGYLVFYPGMATFGPSSKLHRSAGGIPRLPDLAFPNMGVESPRWQLPGAVARSHPSPKLRRYLMDNEFNRRAREGFRYWLIEKPKPTKCELCCCHLTDLNFVSLSSHCFTVICLSILYHCHLLYPSLSLSLSLM